MFDFLMQVLIVFQTLGDELEYLENSRLRTKGWTSRQYSHDVRGLVGATKPHDSAPDEKAVFLSQTFGTIRTTKVLIKIDPADFKALASLMFEADKKAAIQAFAQILKATA
ncbi:hypothetical protein LJR235_002904 [Pararhizobium sp. LjRoot235]|uniref:hypothetical protein n=1 Tax=Pararhizobium sp. LjRoot235 TaxID=3342291 RepID=UPI003ECF3564